jgi:hypothetical protein
VPNPEPQSAGSNELPALKIWGFLFCGESVSIMTSPPTSDDDGYWLDWLSADNAKPVAGDTPYVDHLDDIDGSV